jgi:hypothetical protein
MGRGMKMLAQIYGGIKFSKDGKTTTYIYDYDKDVLVEESEFKKQKKKKKEKKEIGKNQTKLF